MNPERLTTQEQMRELIGALPKRRREAIRDLVLKVIEDQKAGFVAQLSNVDGTSDTAIVRTAAQLTALETTAFIMRQCFVLPDALE